MGYPIYKLLRAVNRQYPNNGFINYVDVREDMYDSYKDQMIDEDLRDLINETIQEVYKDVALDEVYSFPTVPGQNQYVLPEDCDLRDIQEVTRTYRGIRGPLPTPPPPGPGPTPETVEATFDANGGTGTMPPISVEFGEILVLPECDFVAPEELSFKCWQDNAGNEYNPGDEVNLYSDETFSAIWHNEDPEPVWEVLVRIFVTTSGGVGILHYQPIGEEEQTMTIAYADPGFTIDTHANVPLSDLFTVLEMHDANDVFIEGLNFVDIVPTDDMEIGCAVPVVEPDLDPEPDWEDPDE